MALTLAAAVQELERLKHSRAIWLETVEHLAKFVDQEVRTAEQAIAAEGCVESRVPQPVIKEFIAYINQEEIEPLNEKIEEIESLTVTETKTNDPKIKESSNRTQAQPEANEGPKIGAGGKKLRTISGHPGRKAQGVG